MRPVFLLDCFTGSVVQDADIYKNIKRQIKEQNAQKAEILKAQMENTKQGFHSCIGSTLRTDEL